MKKLHWGIIGCGYIAGNMAQALQEVNGEIYAVCDIDKEKANAFKQDHQVEHVYYDLQDLLADEQVDVVYVATPHNSHYAIMKQVVTAKKHVLCEKAITVNDRQLEEIVSLAKENNVIVQEAMTIFHMPLYKKLQEIVRAGTIGKVKMVQVNFGSCKEYDVTNRFFSKELAGGALLDIGGYATSFARYFLSSCPSTVITTAQYFETGVDEQSGIVMKNADGQMVVMALSMRAKQPKRGVISGELGYIEVSEYPRSDKATITYTSTGEQEVINCGKTSDALQYEVIDMQEYIEHNSGQYELQLSRDVSSLLSQVRTQWGMVYPFE